MGTFVKKEDLGKAAKSLGLGAPKDSLAALVGENSAKLAFGEDSPFGSTNLTTMGTNGLANGGVPGANTVGPLGIGTDRSYVWREMSKQISTRALAAMVGTDLGGFQPMKSLTGSAYSLRAIVDVPASVYQTEDDNLNKMNQWEPMAPQNVAKYSGYSGGISSGEWDATTGTWTARNWTQQGYGGAGAANTQGVVFVPTVDGTGALTALSAVSYWNADGTPHLLDVPSGSGLTNTIAGASGAALTDAQVAEFYAQFNDWGQGAGLEQVIDQRARNWSSSLTQPGTNMGPDAFATGTTANANGTTGTTTTGTSVTSPNSDKMATLKFVIDQQTITATSKRLAASFDLLTQRYVKDVHGVDMFEFALQQISHQVALEKDREMIQSFKYAATDIKAGGGDIAAVDLSTITDNRQGAAMVMGVIMTGRQAITTATGFGPANKLLVSPDVCAILESSPATAFTRIQPDANFNGGLILNGAKQTKVGTIGGIFDVYVDPYATYSYALLAYRGSNPFEAGVIYHPYMFESMEAMEPTTGTPIISVWSADAISSNLISAGSYYRLIRFTGLQGVNGLSGVWKNGAVVAQTPKGWGVLS